VRNISSLLKEKGITTVINATPQTIALSAEYGALYRAPSSRPLGG
jgi:hypothetical protein